METNRNNTTSSAPPQKKINPKNRLQGLRKKVEELSILTDCEALLIAYPNPSSTTSSCFSWPDDPQKRLSTIERYRKVTKQENKKFKKDEAVTAVVGKGKQGFSVKEFDAGGMSEEELDELLLRINEIQKEVHQRIRVLKLKEEERGRRGGGFDEVEICTSWEGGCSDYSGLEEGEIVEVADGGGGGRMEMEVGCSKTDSKEHWPGSELVLALPGTDDYRGITGKVKQKEQEFCRETPQKPQMQTSPKDCGVMRKKGELYVGLDNDHHKEHEFCVKAPQKQTSPDYCGVMSKKGKLYLCFDNDQQKEQEFCCEAPQKQTSPKHCGVMMKNGKYYAYVDDDHQKPPRDLVLETETSKDAFRPIKKRKHGGPLAANAEPSLKKANRLPDVLKEKVSDNPLAIEGSKEDCSSDLLRLTVSGTGQSMRIRSELDKAIDSSKVMGGTFDLKTATKIVQKAAKSILRDWQGGHNEDVGASEEPCGVPDIGVDNNRLLAAVKVIADVISSQQLKHVPSQRDAGNQKELEGDKVEQLTHVPSQRDVHNQKELEGEKVEQLKHVPCSQKELEGEKVGQLKHVPSERELCSMKELGGKEELRVESDWLTL